ncbi:MAG TPA: FtsW/RodA/SpoVE family cell cycle protein [bacterium]|nr:rod shape-determining protein RodA [Candidatus Omnitrophota bacterium]HOJ60736.1 FtsW/RodA/SpoVE family cell cycle protein [bacterium]HPP02033.1 FtsW/RodA/SpoVE family cell cycle protein [bacterium]
MLNWKNWYDIDFLTLGLALALIAFGVAVLAGATWNEEVGSLWETRWFLQAQWAVLGLGGAAAVLVVDYRLLIRYAWFFYALGLIGLLLCFVPGLGHFTHGAYSWVKIGPLPQIQTSEFAKLTTILLLAKILAARKEQWHGLADVLRPLVIGAVPALLVLKQPDLGTAVVFGPITLLMMFIAGLPYPYLILILSPALGLLGISHDLVYILVWIGLMAGLLILAVVKKVPWTVWLPFLLVTVSAYAVVYQHGEKIWNDIDDYKKRRITGFLYPDLDLKHSNWNIYQSKIALGSGGFWGKGFGNSIQSQYGFLPEFQHDFVFPVVGEQKGFLGASLLLALFFLLLMRGLDTAVTAKTLQGALIASGVVALYFSHITINVGMVTGLMPVTGLPLTFISYGGSFMLASLIGIGLLMNVRLRSAAGLMDETFRAGRPQMELPKPIPDDF